MKPFFALLIATLTLCACQKTQPAVIAKTDASQTSASAARYSDSVRIADSLHREFEKMSGSSSDEWNYDSDVDQMRGVTTKYARLYSVTDLNLAFPYEGGRIYTLLRKKGSHQTEAIVILSKGQFHTSYDGVPITAKAEDGPLVQFTGYEPETGNGALFVRPVSKFVSLLRSSKHLTLEVPIYDQGDKQVEFKTGNLQWRD